MAITATAQNVINWGRLFIPDPKTRTFSLDGEVIGRTALPTNQRETFYIKRPALGSVQLYVEPYFYSSTASLGAAAATDKVFQYNATLQTCQFPSASSDPSIRPAQFRDVKAYYQTTEKVPYAYSDNELVTFLPAALEYLNNTYGFSYTHSGTISTFLPVYSTDSDRQLMAMGLAVIVRKHNIEEQRKRGLGVALRAPMQAIDTKTQLNAYISQTKDLEKSIEEKANTSRVDAGLSGGEIDLYDENIVS